MTILLSSHRAARSCRLATLLLVLFAALPGSAHVQKAAAPAAAPAPNTLPVPANKETASSKEASKEAEVGETATQEMLAQDSRLDRLLSLDVISVPLGEVLQKESLDKGTDKMEDAHRFLLTAAPDCADLKMQIRLNNRPLRMLMTALAQMLPGVWTRTPHGYQLGMTRQAADARAEWWSLFLGEREKALALQRQAVLAAMQTKARRRQADDPDPEQSDRAVEEDAANQHDFFQSLPPDLKEQIAANMDENAFYEKDDMGVGNDGELSGTFGWLSQMSPETQEKFKAAMQSDVNRMAQAPPAYQKYAVQAQKDVSVFDPSRVFFWFANGGTSVLATPVNGPPSLSTVESLNVPTTEILPVLALDHSELADEVYGGRLTAPAWRRQADDLRKMGDAASPEWKHIIYNVYGMGDAAPLAWKQLAAYQRSRVWPNTLPKLPPEDYSTWHPSISRAGRVDWLGEKGHMEYVSDYYSQGGYAMPEDQKKQPVRRPLATELNEIAARHEVSWTKDGDGVYLVRNNRWYRDDGLEVPQPLLRRWFAALLQTRRQEATHQQEAALAASQAAPQTPEERLTAQKQDWDWAADVFSTLTPWQIRNGLAKFQPEEKDLALLNDETAAKLNEKLKHYIPQGISVPGTDYFAEANRMPPFFYKVNLFKGLPHTVQLYGSLDDRGRTALLEERLPVSSLNTVQEAQAVSLQPFLPQAMQRFPPDSVLLGLGPAPRMRLEMATPPTAP